MSDVKHTPGPWKMVRYTGHEPQKHWPGRIVSESGVEVFSGPFSFHALRGKTAEANARLIAAAPDLLAALKKAHATMVLQLLPEVGSPVEKEARAAIEKAGTANS